MSERNGSTRHIAHAEGWQAVCTAPDLCTIGRDVVAFNSFATLDKAFTASTTVKARGTAVYRQGDLIRQVQADAGKHFVSGTSLDSGYVKILEGHANVKVNGVPVARHHSRCLINCDAAGKGGAPGKLMTEQKSVKQSDSSAGASGRRSSAKLRALEEVRGLIEKKRMNLDALDELIGFDKLHQLSGEAIASINGKPGTLPNQAAQIARGFLGFGKDNVLNAAEMGYQGTKSWTNMMRFPGSKESAMLLYFDAEILLENIRLGNYNAEILKQDAVNLGKSLVKPVTDAWAKGNRTEAVTRGLLDTITIALGFLKAAKAAKAAQATKKARKLAEEQAAEAARATTAAKKSSATAGAHADDGIHIKGVEKPKFSGDWNNYKTDGITQDPKLSPEGRSLVKQYEAKGLDAQAATDSAKDLMKTGSTLPVPTPIRVGDKLFKVVPEGVTPGVNSAFWTSADEISALRGLNYDQIASRLGLPLNSQQGIRFQVVEITAQRAGTSFVSVIAPTSELGANGVLWTQRGGGIQTLLTDRSIFTQPILTTTTFP